jgi:hypothetical protein
MARLQYQSGEFIEQGDRVLYHGDPGQLEFVVNELTGDPAMDWHFRTNGRGVMVAEPKHFGRLYITDVEHDEDFVFVSRGATF